jgi:prepilin-type N-terminal cleavage/methylation domain-containing protein
MNRRRSHGFTLIELLVVIGIIAVIAAILIPVLSRSRESGRRNTCISNLHSIGIAMAQLREDNGAYPRPPNDTVSGSYVNYAGPGPPPLPLVTGLGLFALVTGGQIDGVSSFGCPNDDRLPEFNVNTGAGITSYNEYYNYFGYKASPAGEPCRFLRIADAEAAGQPESEAAEYHYSNQYDEQGRAMWDNVNHLPTAVFPGLYNRRAPGNTIITHCPYHRQFYRTTVEIDVVARADGSAQAIKRNQYPYEAWVRQAAALRVYLD